MSRFNVLYLTSELYPMAKVGGLADVAGALPKVLKDLDHDIRVFIPKYRVIRDRKYNLREVIRLRDIEVPLGGETITISVKSGFVPDSKVQAYFLEYKPYFDRDDIYVDPATGKGFEDDAFRFALFSKAALEMLKVLYWQPDLVHVNDWPSAMLPYYLKTEYRDDPFFEKTRTLLTIHNLAYQGVFPPAVVTQVLSPDVKFDKSHPAWHHGDFNFLRAGIVTADLITSVSPTYAEQILTPDHGAGLDDVLSEKRDKVFGVLNGIDTDVWNPETDGELAANYSSEDLSGKQACREKLIREMKLDPPENLLVGVVARLVTQKGYDLFVQAAERLLALPVNFVILGAGEPEVEKAIRELAKQHPGRIVARIAFDNALAHRIEAGADAFLMPSRYEPCGLNQMYSLRYGTPPIVHGTGGLADTVSEFDPASGTGNGFRFDEFSVDELVAAVDRAVRVSADQQQWKRLMLNGMKQDFSWTASATKLVEVYEHARQMVEA